jgi:predicted nucleotidyltransferase
VHNFCSKCAAAGSEPETRHPALAVRPGNFGVVRACPGIGDGVWYSLMTIREQEILAHSVKVLRERLDPARIILFGSRAKGTSRPRADFDLAVDGERPDSRMERLIVDEIERKAGLYKVDVVYLCTVDERFRAIVLATGKPIYERRNQVRAG